MKCRMFALSLALGALLCLAPSAAALAAFGTGLLAAGQCLTRKAKRS